MSAAQRQVVRGGMAALCSAPSGSAGPRRAALQRRPPVPPQQRQRHQQHQQRRQRLPAPGGVGSSSGQDSRGEATRAAWSTAAAAPPAPRADPTAQGARCGAAAALSTCSQTRASASAQSGPIGHGTMTHRGRSCRPASSHGGTASGMRPHGSWCAAVAAAASPSSRFGGGRLGHARSSGAAPHSISAASTLPSAAPRTLPRAHAFNIDVQARMERAWARQHEAEAAAAAATAALLQPGAVTGVSTLAQLDALVEAAGTNLVVVFMYSRVRRQDNRREGGGNGLAGAAGASLIVVLYVLMGAQAGRRARGGRECVGEAASTSLVVVLVYSLLRRQADGQGSGVESVLAEVAGTNLVIVSSRLKAVNPSISYSYSIAQSQVRIQKQVPTFALPDSAPHPPPTQLPDLPPISPLPSPPPRFPVLVRCLVVIMPPHPPELSTDVRRVQGDA
eukprot:139163-Chlamydomonas_euryale.AAC.2